MPPNINFFSLYDNQISKFLIETTSSLLLRLFMCEN